MRRTIHSQLYEPASEGTNCQKSSENRFQTTLATDRRGDQNPVNRDYLGFTLGTELKLLCDTSYSLKLRESAPRVG